MTFYGLYKAAIAGNQIYAENSHGVVASRTARSNSSKQTTSAFHFPPSQHWRLHQSHPRKMGDDLTPQDFKAFDLGGRDIKTIMGVMEGKVPLDKMPIRWKDRIDDRWNTLLLAPSAHNIRNGPNGPRRLDLSGPARISGLGTSDWFLLNPH